MANNPIQSEDIQRLLITQAMGQALAAWARVEEEMSLVFIHAMGATFDPSARAVFFSVRSFEARLGMTDAAIKAMYPPLPEDTLGKEWNALHNRLRVKNKSRNEIAHAGVLFVATNGGKSIAYADPYLNVTSRRSLPIDTNLRSLKQITEAEQGFISAALRISAFEMDLAAHLKRQPTSLLRANHSDPAVRNPASQRFRELAKLSQPFDPSPQSDDQV